MKSCKPSITWRRFYSFYARQCLHERWRYGSHRIPVSWSYSNSASRELHSPCHSPNIRLHQFILGLVHFSLSPPSRAFDHCSLLFSNYISFNVLSTRTSHIRTLAIAELPPTVLLLNISLPCEYPCPMPDTEGSLLAQNLSASGWTMMCTL